MSIQTEIDRIKSNVQNTISTIEQTGVSIPEGANSDDLPSLAAALANEKQDKADAVSVPGGASLSMDSGLGSTPFVIEFDEETDDAPILTFGAQSVATSAWTADTTYEGYGFRAAVALSGVTADYVPSVTFGVADATGGNLAPVADTYAGGVYVYAKETPSAAVSVLSVMCAKGV